MKNTTRPAKENLILGGNGLFILGAILFITGLILMYVHKGWHSFFCGWFRCHGIRPYCHEEAGIYPSGDLLVTTKNTLLRRPISKLRSGGRGFPFFGFAESLS